MSTHDTSQRLASVHPGEVLIEEFLAPLGITQYRLAQVIDVPQGRVSQIVSGQRAVTVDTAMRLARALGTTEEFWLNLQTHHDLDIGRDELAAHLDRTIARLTA